MKLHSRSRLVVGQQPVTPPRVRKPSVSRAAAPAPSAAPPAVPPAGAESPTATHQTAREPDPVIMQAKRDIDAGLVDTDMHATPGLDAALRAKLVPGAGGKPPLTRR